MTTVKLIFMEGQALSWALQSFKHQCSNKKPNTVFIGKDKLQLCVPNSLR